MPDERRRRRMRARIRGTLVPRTQLHGRARKKSGIPVGKIEKNFESDELRVNFLSDFSQLRFVKLKSFNNEKKQ